MSNCPSRSNKDSTAIAPVAAVGNDVGLGLELSPPIVEIAFPDLRYTIAALVKFLLSGNSTDIKVDCLPYKTVVKHVGGPEIFVGMVYDTIDPLAKSLQGRIIDIEKLDDIRQKQATGLDIWHCSNGGYLDYIRDTRSPLYWRAYVGQSENLHRRISQHTNAIRKGSANNLHYYIIKEGAGYRYANFIRLWTIPFPGSTDRVTRSVFNNVLEKVMCLAFQSLPARTLEQVFGPPENGKYSGIGLNVVSPLFQGRELGYTVRDQAVCLLEESPDPEIKKWPSFRRILKAQRDQDSQQSHKIVKSSFWNSMTPFDHLAALWDAIETNTELENPHLPQSEDSIWRIQEEEPIDLSSWFESVSASILQQGNLTQADLESPFGSTRAPIGIILDHAPSCAYGDGRPNLPWGLHESGFTETNSLIWSFNLQKFTYISGTFQAAPLHIADEHVLSAHTWRLICGSQMRVILLCGHNSEKIAMPANIRLRSSILKLHDFEYQVWLDIEESRINRTFIRSPAPLGGLWATKSREACQLGTLFRFVSDITGTKLRQGFYESAVSLALIIRNWDDENNKKIEKIAPANLEPLLQAWLAKNGFETEEQIRRLEQSAGGSLRYGLLVLSLVVPRQVRSTGVRRIPDSKAKRLGTIDRNILSAVKSLYLELHPGSSTPEEYKVTGEYNAADEHAIHEAAMCGVMLDDEDSDREYTEIPEPKLAANTRIGNFKNRLCLALGCWYQGRERAPGHYSVDIQHTKIYINATRENHKGGFWVKAELSPPGVRNPNVWAQDIRDGDPGARLAFRISIKESDGQETFVRYASHKSWQSCCKANTLVDELNGDQLLEIYTRPRRFIDIDHRNTRILAAYPALKSFIGGAFTDDNGVVMSRKRKDI
ncbi:hypothetical protein BO79DRAFT_277284 [Aspergillus costaricaensis CBS 115574]|uniref:Uncharacterized protein n=1 Tax=Aspergillus costaricaensis CBS 115574 TaxID=1448317 RepID=A0ACD1IP62_9EURO|nr:hypothetical protein BO79DRAFT_277284 [Aspergillus costaricaensis CBS 115574]RAK92466.1 hypothetical protein BO79DRAFT_277284 [Aspergillus costaricaensis CBS 115574]